MNYRRLAVTALVSIASLLPLAAFAQTNCEAGAGPLRHEQPDKMTAEQIIQKFTANEAATDAARKSYTFTQDTTVQTLHRELAGEWKADGEFRLVTDVSFDGQGKRLEAVKFAPQSTLRRMSLEREDYEDIRHFATFALTTHELPHYNVMYAGQQHVDELDTYVFDVAPKTIEKDKRYWQGRIWVEQHDLQVVKTCGKSVPDPVVKKKKKIIEQGLMPKFATYREFIDGMYWFPTYSRSDEVLQFGNEDVKLREIIHFTDYHRANTVGQPMKQALSNEPPKPK